MLPTEIGSEEGCSVPAIKAYRVPLGMATATASGTTRLSDPVTAGGYLEAVRLVRPATNQLSTVASLTITDELTGLVLFQATATSTGSQTWLPRTQVVDASGVLLGLTSAATPPPLVDKQPISANSRFRVVVASGGATGTSGVLWCYLSGA